MCEDCTSKQMLPKACLKEGKYVDCYADDGWETVGRKNKGSAKVDGQNHNSAFLGEYRPMAASQASRPAAAPAPAAAPSAPAQPAAAPAAPASAPAPRSAPHVATPVVTALATGRSYSLLDQPEALRACARLVE